jgi:hypothetical protein
LLAAYLTFSTWADFTRFNQVLVAMARASVPESWLPVLGTLKGAAGLLKSDSRQVATYDPRRDAPGPGMAHELAS